MAFDQNSWRLESRCLSQLEDREHTDKGKVKYDCLYNIFVNNICIYLDNANIQEYRHTNECAILGEIDSNFCSSFVIVKPTSYNIASAK